MKKIIFFFVFVLLFLTAHKGMAEGVVDSLESALQNARTDSAALEIKLSLVSEYSKTNPEKALSLSYSLKREGAKKYKENSLYRQVFIKAMNNIGYLYRQQGYNDSAAYYYNYSLSLAKQYGDSSLIGTGFSNTAYLDYAQGRTEEAAKKFRMARQIFIDLKDTSNILVSNNNLGSMLYLVGENDRAVELFIHSMEIAEERGQKEDVAILATNIGKMYQSEENFKMAREYIQKSVDIYKEVNDYRRLGRAYSNLGSMYQALGEPDTAKKYLDEAMVLSKKFNDIETQGTTLHHLGLLYRSQGEIDRAIEMFEKSLKLKEKVGINNRYLVTLHNLGVCYHQKGDYDKAIDIFEKGLKLSEESKLPHRIKFYRHSLAKAYKKSGNYRKALLHYEEYMSLNDSLTSRSNNEKLAEIEASFNKEKRELQIKNLKKQQKLKEARHREQLKRENIQKIAFAGGFGLTLILAFVIFRGLRQKQKANKLIETQKEEVEHQKVKVEEKNKEILDSINYARRIQNALLKSEQHVTDHFPPHFIYFKPKDIVSGDFYWAREVKGRLYLTVADCTGHGVPGAFMSMLGIAFLNEITGGGKALTPDKILNQLRDKIIQELGQKGIEGETRDGMDISFVQFDPKNNTLLWSGANNPVWVLTSNKEGWPEEARIFGNESPYLVEIKGDKQPIGYSPEPHPFALHRLKLNQGDEFFMFSDGYPDQFGGPKGKKFKYKPLKKLLRSLRNEKMSDKKEILDKSFNRWKGSLEQIDDVCILGVKVNGE